MATRVEREGIEECVNKINEAIDHMKDAATQIDGVMAELPQYWEGAAYDKASSTYAEEYQTLLTKSIPESVDSFKQYINNCKAQIIELDEQLAGAGN